MVARRVRDMWDRLTKPALAIQDYEHRRNSQLVATLFLVLFPLGLMATVVTPIMKQSGSFFRDWDFRVTIGGMVFWGIAYGLSRTGRYKPAVWLAVSVACITIFASTLPDSQLKDLDFLIIPLLLGSLFLSTRANAVLVTLNLVGIFILAWIKGDVTPIQIARTMSFTLTGTTLLFLGVRHREVLE